MPIRTLEQQDLAVQHKLRQGHIKQRTQVANRLEQAADAQRDSAIGTAGGMAGAYAIKNDVFAGPEMADAAQTEALTSGVAESNAASAEAVAQEALAANAAEVEAGLAAETIALEGATAAEGAVAAEATTAAVGAEVAGAATVEAAGTAATMGPVGWVAAARILAYSLFG